MKKVSLFILIFLSVRCIGQPGKAMDSVLSIGYYAYGMISEFSMTIDSAKIEYQEFSRRSDKNDKTKRFVAKLDAYEWRSILSQVALIDLKNLDSLWSPTNHRSVDGALYAGLVIRTPFKEYRTREFDEGLPMKEIRNLLIMIDRIINRRLVSDRYEEIIQQDAAKGNNGKQ